ncbi:monofunctional biosynthetic peptidoglycan transglycosylase [Pseudomonas sp. GX19020]|uniref:monofunctional biosynthetic peptidoglycan transglycosylase n=1 Tax=Pseudomonadota TaxID=1224 RepID=UPI0008948099|nr:MULTISPECIES: monofunctional biosynthetic peptidoglycan transglycosylase [Pseudomonadota]MCL4067651.1 monofunctional biosynthetic peptidoglycan transglycosylase [Pseudomonas sp. GX19020]SEC49943.1 monofunctional biosynthetic peptidoglycan transglycosylase [Rhodobacter sp. 24-YEA-8]
MSDEIVEQPEEKKPVVRKPRKKPAAGATGAKSTRRRGAFAQLRRWALRAVLGVVGFFLVLILLFSFLPPPINIYQMQEKWRLGAIDRKWVSWDEIAPVMGRAAVAAEDANFCNHWGFDMTAIRDAINSGSNRGASTITQQVAKNVFLWHDRSYARKAAEAALTPVIELFWSKERILEVYLNVAEFDEGVFGVQAAARHYFGVDAKNLSALQAARLAAVLPDPKRRSASKPSAFVRKRTASIMSGADTIRADGRAGCFQ